MARPQPRMSKLDLLTQNRQHAAQTRRSTADTVTTVTGILRGYTQDPEWRADVEVYGGTVNLPAHAGAYVIDGGVRVQVENGRPTHVLGPTDTPVPDSTVPTTVAEGALPIVIQPAAMIDQESRDRANEAIASLSELFTYSDRAPVPADGVGKPEGAYWIMQNAAGEDEARWRWVDGAWVETPLGPELVLSSAVVSSLLTNEVFTKNLVLSDEADGLLTRVTARGVEIFGPDDLPLSKYGSFAENALNFYSGGDPVASIGDSGSVSGLAGSFGQLSIGGTDFAEILNRQPRGLIYNRNFPLSRDITVRGGHSYIVFDCEPYRSYEVTCRVTARNRDSAGMQVRFYGEIVNQGDPVVEPTLSSPLAAEGKTFTVPDAYLGGSYVDVPFSFIYSPTGTVPKTAALLLAVNPIGTTGDGRLEIAGAWWTVKDVGVNDSTIQKGGSYSNVGGGSAGGGGTPTPEVPKQRHSWTFTSTSWRTFQNVTGDNTGSRTTSVSGPTQGFTPYYPSAGQYASHYYFDTADIQSRVGGGTIISAQVRFKLTHSHSAAGGTARLHLHGHSPRDDWGTPVSYVGDKFFAPGDRHWLGVMSQGWATGAVRGVGLWSRGSVSTSYYTRFSTTAELELVWEK